jgi:hypothetical protein
MNAAHLRALAYQRFISLLMNRPKDDTRTHDTLRKQAAREIIRETRGVGSTGNAPTTANSGFELLLAKVWAICCRQNSYADQRRSLPTVCKLKTEPTIAAAPLVITDEPVEPSLRKSKDDVVVSLPVVTGTGKQTISDSEYPSRFVDQTTNNWRASISQNQEIQKQRDIASARHRSQQTPPRYVG